LSDELEVMEDTSGLDRRTFIKRGAIVGGMVWAAPAISSLGSRAFAADNGTPRKCTEISTLAIVFTIDGVTYQAKYSLRDECEDQGTAAPGCDDPNGWQFQRTSNLDGCLITTWDTTDPCCWKVTIGGEGTITIVGVAVGGGGDDSPAEGGFCVENWTQTNGARTYRWCAP
jgi:hypothetical protein